MKRSCETLKEAQIKKLYQSEFVADKPILHLDNGLIFSIRNSWVENSWTYECIDNKAQIVRDTSYQFVIDADYKGDAPHSSYWLGNNHLGAVLRFIYSGQDRFILLLQKQKSEISVSQNMTEDSIVFTRRQVSR